MFLNYTKAIKQQDSGQGNLLLIPGPLEEVMRPDMAKKSKAAVQMLPGDDHVDSTSWNERKAWAQTLSVHMAAEWPERGTINAWATVTEKVCTWAQNVLPAK